MCNVFSRSIGLELVLASFKAIPMPTHHPKENLELGVEIVFVFATAL